MTEISSKHLKILQKKSADTEDRSYDKLMRQWTSFC